MIFREIKKKAKEIKKSLYILYNAYMDKRTPWYAKVVIGVVIAYALSPIDLIPDFIPVLGYLDDIILIPLGIKLSLRLIPKDVIDEYKEKHDNGIIDKRRGYIGAVVIVFVWVLLIFILINKII